MVSNLEQHPQRVEVLESRVLEPAPFRDVLSRALSALVEYRWSLVGSGILWIAWGIIAGALSGQWLPVGVVVCLVLAARVLRLWGTYSIEQILDEVLTLGGLPAEAGSRLWTSLRYPLLSLLFSFWVFPAALWTAFAIAGHTPAPLALLLILTQGLVAFGGGWIIRRYRLRLQGLIGRLQGSA